MKGPWFLSSGPWCPLDSSSCKGPEPQSEAKRSQSHGPLLQPAAECREIPETEREKMLHGWALMEIER